MIISEKQIMQLISLAWEYADRLKAFGNSAYNIDEFLGEIISQQSEKLIEVKDDNKMD